jgi:di/tricarboxylate transporter
MKYFALIMISAVLSIYTASASSTDDATRILIYQIIPTTRSIVEDIPEATLQRDVLSVSFDDSGMYTLYIEDRLGVIVYTSALPANGMEYDYDLSGIGEGLFRLVLSGSSGEYEGYFTIK